MLDDEKNKLMLQVQSLKNDRQRLLQHTTDLQKTVQASKADLKIAQKKVEKYTKMQTSLRTIVKRYQEVSSEFGKYKQIVNGLLSVITK